MQAAQVGWVEGAWARLLPPCRLRAHTGVLVCACACPFTCARRLGAWMGGGVGMYGCALQGTRPAWLGLHDPFGNLFDPQVTQDLSSLFSLPCAVLTHHHLLLLCGVQAGTPLQYVADGEAFLGLALKVGPGGGGSGLQGWGPCHVPSPHRYTGPYLALHWTRAYTHVRLPCSCLLLRERKHGRSHPAACLQGQHAGRHEEQRPLAPRLPQPAQQLNPASPPPFQLCCSLAAAPDTL